MKSFDLAHLYVEKFSQNHLMVDFIEESEFIYFRNGGDYVENIKSIVEYEPTMLLFTNVGKLPLKENDIFTIPMDFLLDIKSAYQNQIDRNIEEIPINIYMVFSNGELISKLFENNEAHKCTQSLEKFQRNLIETWECGTPCSLNYLGANFTLEVVDVGQGSTNLIYDNNSLTIFDFGVSMHYCKSKCYDVLDKLEKMLDRFCHISLIISHWDCDHYNLLTIMSDKLMREFCCVFLPSQIISLTAQIVAKRISQNCRYVRTFTPPPAVKKRKIGIQPVISKQNYELYIGEQSKSINQSGLALVVRGSHDLVVFGADHSNYQIWECICSHLPSLDNSTLNMVVPHHGGNCGKINSQHIAIKAGIAAISVGKNVYKHPQQETIDKYNILNFEVKRTDWERDNILIKIQ